MNQKSNVDINHVQVICVACLKHEKSYSDSFDALAEIQETFLDLIICQVGLDTVITTKMQSIIEEGNSFCHSCSKLLLDIYNFRQKCLESAKKLVNFLNNSVNLQSFNVTFKSYKELNVDESQDESSKEVDIPRPAKTYKNNNLMNAASETTNNSLDLVKQRLKEVQEKIIQDQNPSPIESPPPENSVPKKKRKQRLMDVVEIKPDNLDDSFSCDICHEVLKKCNFPRHMKSRHLMDQTKEICKYCGQIFDGFTTLKDHLNTAHSKELLQVKYTTCLDCGKEVAKTSMTLHRLRHHNAKRFGCTECDKMFTTKAETEVHFRRSHLPVEWVLCPICKKRLKADGLKRHTIAMHSEKDKNKPLDDMIDAADVTIKNEPVDSLE